MVLSPVGGSLSPYGTLWLIDSLAGRGAFTYSGSLLFFGTFGQHGLLLDIIVWFAARLVPLDGQGNYISAPTD